MNPILWLLGIFNRKKSIRKSNSNKNSKWRNLQNKIAPKSQNLEHVVNIDEQKVLPSGKRPDLYGETFLGEKIVGDSKNVSKLTKEHVKQVKGYIKETNANRGFIVVKKTTKISEDIIQYADEHGITISKMGVTKKAKRLGMINGFDFYGTGGINEEIVKSKSKKSNTFGFGNTGFN